MPDDDLTPPGTFPPQYGAPQELFPAPPPPAAAYEMRPLSVGEVLDRTFALYRSRFWLFAGIAAISGAAQLVLNFIQLFLNKGTLAPKLDPGQMLTNTGMSFVLGIAFLLIYSVTQAATVFAVSENYMGRTTTVDASLSATIVRWYRYIGIALWQGWSAIWVIVVAAVPAGLLLAFAGTAGKVAGGLLLFVAFIGGGVYGVIAYLRNSLAIQASVMEASGVRASMRRSKVLAAGAKGRIFVVLLVTFCMLMVAGVIEAPLLFLVLRSPGERHIVAQSVVLFVNFFAHVVVTPVGLVGMSLLYFDQRVRMEGFDLLLLLGPEVSPAPAVTVETPEAAAVSEAPGA